MTMEVENMKKLLDEAFHSKLSLYFASWSINWKFVRPINFNFAIHLIVFFFSKITLPTEARQPAERFFIRQQPQGIQTIIQPTEELKKCIYNSRCFGLYYCLYEEWRQVGFKLWLFGKRAPGEQSTKIQILREKIVHENIKRCWWCCWWKSK